MRAADRRIPAGAALGALLLPLVLTSCVTPASSSAVYAAKGAQTAADARSEVETARLSAEASSRGRLPAAYREAVLVDSEAALGALQATFGSVQPPHTRAADEVQKEADELLSAAIDGVSALRVAARRDDTAALVELERSLGPVSEALAAFEQRNSR